MNQSFLFAACVAIIAGKSYAAPRTSAHYSVLADVADVGGRRSASANYIHHGSAGAVAGVSAVALPPETIKAGFIAQLFEVVGFVVNASPSSVDEGAARQLDPAHLLDDATLLTIMPALVSWRVASGPVASISPGGLAAMQIVYQNTPATVQGSFGGFTGSLTLTVLNVNIDDLPGYSGDGIGDDWQVQYFGLPPNPAAGPLLDADGDGQNNFYEWVAGLNPTDPMSVFKLRIERSSQGAHLVFSPIVSGRSYTVTYRPDLLVLPPWPTLPPGLPTFNVGSERTVIDTGAPAQQGFYRVNITQP